MRNYFCEGEYSRNHYHRIRAVFFGEDHGYLTLTKTDHRRVWLWDLEDFPDGKWVVAEANKDTGAYEVYFHAGPNFKMRLGSVKWNEIP